MLRLSILLISSSLFATTTTFEITASGNDGGASTVASCTGYPSTGGSLDTAQPTLFGPTKSGNGTNCDFFQVALIFDTSSIPDTAVVTAATLRIYPTLLQSTSTCDVYIDYFSGAYSWAAPSGTGAIVANATWFGWTLNAYNTVSLAALSNISKTGNTSIRISMSGCTPTGSQLNQVNLEAFDAAGSNEPQLEVTYVQSSTKVIVIAN